MTTYHRFFIPGDASVGVSDVRGALSHCSEEFRQEGDVVFWGDKPVGILEISSEPDPIFTDDLDLALRHARKQNLVDDAISNLSKCTTVVSLQPIGDDFGRCQTKFWDQLFRLCPNGLLMFEGGVFQLDPFLPID